MKIRLVSKIVFVLVIFSAMLLHAQDSASVTGTVRDQSGATVANAQVTVSAADRGINRETTSNGDGEYSVAALPPGSYDIAVTAQGFKKSWRRALRVAQKLAWMFLFKSASNTEVNVEGVSVARVETRSSDLRWSRARDQPAPVERPQLYPVGHRFLVWSVKLQDEGTVGVYGNVATA
jgi:hypothetical protein